VRVSATAADAAAGHASLCSDAWPDKFAAHPAQVRGDEITPSSESVRKGLAWFAAHQQATAYAAGGRRQARWDHRLAGWRSCRRGPVWRGQYKQRPEMPDFVLASCQESD
jgi:hypothetical protein